MLDPKPKNTTTGYKKQNDVAKWLGRHGWDITYEGGRGPADIIAVKGGKHWFIQVKYTRKSSMDWTRFSREMEPLIRIATKEDGTAIFCFVVQNRVWFTSAKTGRDLARGYL